MLWNSTKTRKTETSPQTSVSFIDVCSSELKITHIVTIWFIYDKRTYTRCINLVEPFAFQTHHWPNLQYLCTEIRLVSQVHVTKTQNKELKVKYQAMALPRGCAHRCPA